MHGSLFVATLTGIRPFWVYTQGEVQAALERSCKECFLPPSHSCYPQQGPESRDTLNPC